MLSRCHVSMSSLFIRMRFRRVDPNVAAFGAKPIGRMDMLHARPSLADLTRHRQVSVHTLRHALDTAVPREHEQIRLVAAKFFYAAQRRSASSASKLTSLVSRLLAGAKWHMACFERVRFVGAALRTGVG